MCVDLYGTVKGYLDQMLTCRKTNVYDKVHATAIATSGIYIYIQMYICK